MHCITTLLLFISSLQFHLDRHISIQRDLISKEMPMLHFYIGPAVADNDNDDYISLKSPLEVSCLNN